MRFAVISDTHSNRYTRKAYEHMLTYKDKLGLDFVVFNGDLIGHFSLAKSTVHRHRRITEKQLLSYLKEAAPQFYDVWLDKKHVSKQELYEYVAERYAWLCNFLAESSEEIETIWNLGNHESKHHYLVLQELPFLTGEDHAVIQAVDNDLLDRIYALYEEQIKELEQTNNFHYIRDKHLVKGDTMIIGIPGESHGTVGNDEKSRIQERKTQQILRGAKADLGAVSTVVICNHTQGTYKRDISAFEPASPSVKQFLANLEGKRKVFIQSHNHWSYTQFMRRDDVTYILNNAGLHDSIYNFVDIDDEVRVYDVDPETDTIQRLQLTEQFGPKYQNEKAKIMRNYENPSQILERKTRYS